MIFDRDKHSMLGFEMSQTSTYILDSSGQTFQISYHVSTLRSYISIYQHDVESRLQVLLEFKVSTSYIGSYHVNDRELTLPRILRLYGDSNIPAST